MMNYPTNYNASLNRVKSFECPSDTLPTITGTGNIITFITLSPTLKLTGQYSVASMTTAGGIPGLTNYLPCAGTLGHVVNATTPPQVYNAVHEGVFVDETKNTITSVTDGSSNTIFFGEYLGGFNNGSSGGRISAIAWAGSNGFPTYFSMTNPNTQLSFQSLHTGICNFAFGDGSVRPLTQGNPLPQSLTDMQTNGTLPTWETLQSLAGKSDGDVIVQGVIGN